MVLFEEIIRMDELNCSIGHWIFWPFTKMTLSMPSTSCLTTFINWKNYVRLVGKYTLGKLHGRFISHTFVGFIRELNPNNVYFQKSHSWHNTNHHHHHHVMRLARISLTLSLHVSLSFIASGRSSGLHPVSSRSCCMYVRDGRPAFDWPYAGVHRSTSLTISSLLFQQCPACLVRLAWIVFVKGGRWPYSWRLVGCCCQE